MTLLILSAPKDYLRGVEYFGLVMPIMLVTFVGTRLYYLIVAHWAMQSIHALAEKRHQLAFAIGFVPSYLLINALGLALSWFLAALFVVGGD